MANPEKEIKSKYAQCCPRITCGRGEIKVGREIYSWIIEPNRGWAGRFEGEHLEYGVGWLQMTDFERTQILGLINYAIIEGHRSRLIDSVPDLLIRKKIPSILASEIRTAMRYQGLNEINTLIKYLEVRAEKDRWPTRYGTGHRYIKIVSGR